MNFSVSQGSKILSANSSSVYQYFLRNFFANRVQNCPGPNFKSLPKFQIVTILPNPVFQYSSHFFSKLFCQANFRFFVLLPTLKPLRHSKCLKAPRHSVVKFSALGASCFGAFTQKSKFVVKF